MKQGGRLGEAEELLREAFPKAREQGVDWLAADLLRLHGRVLVLQGDASDGEKEMQAALSYAEKKGHVEVAADACGDLAEAAESRGDRDGAGELLRRGLAMIEARETRDAAAVRLQLYNRLGRLELQSGDFSGAVARFTQALSLAERLEDRYQTAGLFGNLGGAYARRGEMDRAVHYTERALRASEAIGDQIGIARQSFNLALLRLSAGQRTTARQLLRGSYDAARRAGWREGLAMSAAATAKLDGARA